MIGQTESVNELPLTEQTVSHTCTHTYADDDRRICFYLTNHMLYDALQKKFYPKLFFFFVVDEPQF